MRQRFGSAVELPPRSSPGAGRPFSARRDDPSRGGVHLTRVSTAFPWLVEFAAARAAHGSGSNRSSRAWKIASGWAAPATGGRPCHGTGRSGRPSTGAMTPLRDRAHLPPAPRHLRGLFRFKDATASRRWQARSSCCRTRWRSRSWSRSPRSPSPPIGSRLRHHAGLLGGEPLGESGELESVARRHAAYYRDLFERIEGDWEARPSDGFCGPTMHGGPTMCAWPWNGAFSATAMPRSESRLTAATIPLWMHLSSLYGAAAASSRPSIIFPWREP